MNGPEVQPPLGILCLAPLLEDLVGVIKSEMDALKNGPNQEEFEIARAQLKAGLMMALEATTSRMEQLGRQMLVFDRVVPVPEMIGNVESVSVEDIADVAAELVEYPQPSIAVVGDAKAVEPLLN